VRFRYITLPKTPPRPYLNVVLRNGSKTSDILKALVDSGADHPIFPMEIAEHYLALDLSNAEPWNFSGTTGDLQSAKLANVSLAVLAPNRTDHFCEVKIVCAFCESFKFSGGALLGQNGFFSEFKIIFHQPDGYFDLDQW
jgi:hypothetical protein